MVLGKVKIDQKNADQRPFNWLEVILGLQGSSLQLLGTCLQDWPMVPPFSLLFASSSSLPSPSSGKYQLGKYFTIFFQCACGQLRRVAMATSPILTITSHPTKLRDQLPCSSSSPSEVITGKIYCL